MKKTIIGVLIVIAALAIGVGGAYLVVRPWASATGAWIAQDENPLPYFRQGRGMWPFGPQTEDRLGPGMMGGHGRGQGRGSSGPGMMHDWFSDDAALTGERISMDDALVKAQEYVAGKGDNLRVAEIMEFENNFYAVVVETDTGKGAFELLVHPVSGQVIAEPGPNMMWNTKYGHMAQADPIAVNSVTMKEAASLAQKALDRQGQEAKVSANGVDFYGYYSFDYEIGGKVAGMLSVNGETGRVWFHNWHGGFIGEKEIEK